MSILRTAARGLALLAATGSALMVGSVCAGAAETGLPADVQEWFAHDAAEIIAQTQQDAVSADDEPAITYTSVDVGTPVELFTWAEEYVEGQEPAPATEPLGQWIAPLTDQGEPVGLVSAVRDNGAVVMAFFDNNAITAQRLLATPTTASIVYDGPLDAYFSINDGKVFPLSDNSTAELASPMSVTQFQDQLVERYADVPADEAAADALVPGDALVGGGPSVPTSLRSDGDAATQWLAITGIILVMTGAGLLVRHTRTKRHDTEASAAT